jgi:hypothetical protein
MLRNRFTKTAEDVVRFVLLVNMLLPFHDGPARTSNCPFPRIKNRHTGAKYFIAKHSLVCIYLPRATRDSQNEVSGQNFERAQIVLSKSNGGREK